MKKTSDHFPLGKSRGFLLVCQQSLQFFTGILVTGKVDAVDPRLQAVSIFGRLSSKKTASSGQI